MISYLNADLCKMFKTRRCNTLDNTLEGIYFNKNTKLLLPIQCSAVKFLPERRSGPFRLHYTPDVG
jgi:hypothetical protein